MRSTAAPAVTPEVTGVGDEIMGNDVGCGEEEREYARGVWCFTRIMEGQAAQAVDCQIEAPCLIGARRCPGIRCSSTRTGPLL